VGAALNSHEGKMRMNMRALLEDACDVIQSALPAIFERRYSIRYKEDGSPVTEADIFIERLIGDWLRQRLDGVVFVGEESHDHRAVDMGGYVVLMDPIDGTENFCSGLKEWGSCLSVWADGQHLGSALMLPELGERLITGDKVIARQSRITGFSSSFDESILQGIREAGEYRVTGCAVYNLHSVIMGSFKRFINPKGACAWDLMPGLMLALENGCTVFVDDEVFDGKFLQPDRKYRIDIQR